MAQTLNDTFWTRISDVRAGLLSAAGERPVPMAPLARRDDNAIWFITADGTAADRAAETKKTAAFHVADPKAHLYACIEGQLEVSHDSEKLDELWSPMSAAWFDDGRKDGDVRLIKFTPSTGELWATDGGAKYLFEVAKANVTDDQPDAGDHGTLVF
ncbi:pyridoxamine 5'-phosphate oxidase family protein [Primorskyibacter sp. 2E107]|uniref:pyridoxamine 5'-phosphate oxidase family protein n=1 Tax=Primorskyibacter sp. 2E107 TaxID=3403458 RepID=UPI003AF83D00